MRMFFAHHDRVTVTFFFLALCAIVLVFSSATASAQQNVENKMRHLQFQIDELRLELEKKPFGAYNYQPPISGLSTQRADYNSFLERIQAIEGVIDDLTNRIERIEFQLSQSLANQPSAPSRFNQNTDVLSPDAKVGAPSLQNDLPSTTNDVHLGVLPDLNSLKLPWNNNQQQDGQAEQPTPKTTPDQSANANTGNEDPLILNENDLYDRSFTSVQNGDFDAARKGFRVFLDNFGESNLASNAFYWLGETFYADQDFAEAATLFLQGYQSFPKGNKASASLFKLGMSLLSLDQPEEACTAFGLVENYQDQESTTVRELAANQFSRFC